MTSANQNSFPWEESREVEFFIVDDKDHIVDEKPKGRRNTGTLIEPSSDGTGLLTRIPLQPGDIVQLNHGGTLRLGVVMWSVESANNFRVQMRFV